MTTIDQLKAWQETVAKHCNEQTVGSLLHALADILIEERLRCITCGLLRDAHFHPDEWPQVARWHCARCRKPMQFADGICFACNGGRDPGD